MKSKEIGVVLATVFMFSYGANFIWESLHAAFLFEGHDVNAKRYVAMVMYVAAMDSALITGLYLFIAASWKDLLWLRTMNRKQQSAAFLAGLIIAAVIEYAKVYVLKAWSYTSLMPVLFGIGLSPLFQLSVTSLLMFRLTRRLLYERGAFSAAHERAGLAANRPGPLP